MSTWTVDERLVHWVVAEAFRDGVRARFVRVEFKDFETWIGLSEEDTPETFAVFVRWTFEQIGVVAPKLARIERELPS